jgi:hypothetical protein
MKPDAIALGIGVLALAGAALFVQWFSAQPLDWSVIKAVGEQITSAVPVVAPVTGSTASEE